MAETKSRRTQKTEKDVTGIVTDCLMLNVRKEANIEAEIVCEIPRYTEVTIDNGNSTDEFYKIRTASGTDGFCMKKYIKIHK